MRLGPALLGLALAGCSAESPAPAGNALAPPLDLENAAIERGLVPDPADRDIAGLYARETDRLCIVADGMGYRTGAFADFGEGVSCSGTGRVTRVGDTLHFELGEARVGCSFDAQRSGGRIAFPGQVPEGCASLCSGRASYAGFAVERVSESDAEARALRDPAGKRLCDGP